MSELCMRRTDGPLEITGGPTILRKKVIVTFKDQ